MTCKYCGKPVTLAPSAKARADKYGGPSAYYTKLFPDHSHCVVKARSQTAVDLMRRLAS